MSLVAAVSAIIEPCMPCSPDCSLRNFLLRLRFMNEQNDSIDDDIHIQYVLCWSTVDTRVHCHALLFAGCHSCRSTHSVGALNGDGITLDGLAHPKLTWSFPIVVLSTKGYWLPYDGWLPGAWQLCTNFFGKAMTHPALFSLQTND